MHFSNTIIHWYLQNKRELPWRETKDPYKIWVSEIILQQTRVNQGVGYYRRFLDAFPTVQDLAQSSLDRVLKTWEGLGYYSRARNMHAAAKQVVEEFNGHFPAYYDQLLKLKGVGEYTAAAVASFAFHEAVAVVDGNVYRVLGRYLGIDIEINSAKGKKAFKEAATSLMDIHRPDLYNQALMEYGALYCIVGKPDCAGCVLQENCAAYNNKTVDKLPVKAKKGKVRNRYFNYFIVKNEKRSIYINKRTEKDIWNNLYDFPLIETDRPEEFDVAVEQFTDSFGLNKLEIRTISHEVKHILTHQKIMTRFIHVHVKNTRKLDKQFAKVHEDELKKLAFPRLINRYLESHPL